MELFLPSSLPRLWTAWRRAAALTVFAGSAILFLPPALQAESPAKPVGASISTTLETAPGQIRQFAFDGQEDTFFASAKPAGGADHFTLVLDRPVAIRSITVLAGRPQGGDGLDGAALQVSADGLAFIPLAKFAGGSAGGRPGAQGIQSVRVQPAADQTGPLVIREFKIESNDPVQVFIYPIEIFVDVGDAPEMREWAEKTARICERAYPMINEELKSEGFKPRNSITMRLRSDYKGVAETGGGRITGSVKYFKDHPGDVGAMVHETIHNVQAYSRGVPGWLTEGIADYVRFFKFEPGKLRPPNPDRARYNASYQTTAQFLAFVCEKYDPQFVRKLNALLRGQPYKESCFKDLTGKTVQELGEEWRALLRRRMWF